MLLGGGCLSGDASFCLLGEMVVSETWRSFSPGLRGGGMVSTVLSASLNEAKMIVDGWKIASESSISIKGRFVFFNKNVSLTPHSNVLSP